MNEDVFLADLLCLGNQTLLQGLNLLDELIGLGVCAFKFPPTMYVKWLLQLVSKELSFLLLLKVFLLEQEDLTAEVRDASGLVLCDNQFPLHIGNVLLSADDFSDLLLIVDLTLVEGRLLDLDLLIENLELLVTLD